MSKTLCSTGVCFLNFELIFNLPTDDKSYLSELKKRLLNSVSAVSIVGGSPGLKILKISKSASSLERALSSCKVLLIYDPISMLSTFKISILFSLELLAKSINPSSISNPAS